MNALMYPDPGLAPKRERALVTLSAKAFGARGNGETDDTLALECAFDALGRRGGTIMLPTGTYLVDPGVLSALPDRCCLTSVDPEQPATLLARPSYGEREQIVPITGRQIELSDLVLTGNRTDGQGTTGEWAHGIFIAGGRGITLVRLRIERCWGDGISVGLNKATGQAAEDVWIEDVDSLDNRRQALSIGRASNVTVLRGRYGNTGEYTDPEGKVWPGTLPASGIDIEPDAPGQARAIRVYGAIVQGNDGYGIQVYKRSRDGGNIFDVDLAGNLVENNALGINVYGGKVSAGATAHGAHDITIRGNIVRGNRATGIRIEEGVDGYRIEGNILGRNYQTTRVRAAADVEGWDRKYESDLLIRGGEPVSTGVVGVNHYEAQS